MHLRAIFRNASLLLFVPAAAPAQCLTDGARYHMVGEPQAELVLRKDAEGNGASNLDLILTVPDRTDPFLFQPVQSQGFGSIFAVPELDAIASDDETIPKDDTLTEMPGGGASVSDPFADADFPLYLFARNADGKLVPYKTPAPDAMDLPEPASPAPDAILIAQLASNLWYGTNGTDTPVILPQEIWYLDCK